MKKLMDAFKSLPPEMRMLIAMAGLGTPAGIIYLLARYLHVSTIWVIIGMAVLIAVVGLAGLLISKGFGFRAKRRAQRMATDLASDTGRGPVSMDLRASIKANNDKFFAAIREMRKNLGVSVYDLPWYIVIGDSGCGKTKLVNEGGLTFSTGKPEGYQLGTLNYNWWFTEDAIFIDMAGRLCNPQDDADRREWAAMLEMVGKGRPGFPINGALVCVSAEHLLQDAPEKIEQDANTVLERLRDLQSKLGVTFATYLVITKCDKILGFMQFFDRAERDISFKNQIFGWSKPGDFTQLHDPEQFGRDFDQLYGRLHELRLRRLADDVEEVELGLAYSFPEEFRAFRDPLQTYVRTLFPMIRNPKGVKNLIFRGVYFTSATQQGALILKHLVERLGAQAAEHFTPLENLYPKPRPHFVKDLLFRKVFPENGLVFRNEQQVIRNRKLSRLLWAGTGTLAVVLAGLVALGFIRLSTIIGRPSQDAQATLSESPPEAWQLAGSLVKDVNDLRRGSVWTRVLAPLSAQRPGDDLHRVQLGHFEEMILRPALRQVTEQLRKGVAAPATRPPDPAGDVEFARYVNALQEYTAWYAAATRGGVRAGGAAPGSGAVVAQAGFETLTAVLAPKEWSAQNPQFAPVVTSYFDGIAHTRGWPSPARWLAGPAAADSRQAILEAVKSVHAYLKPYAQLNASHPDPLIREWVRLYECCSTIERRYNELLALGKNTVEDSAAFVRLAEDFDKAYGAQGPGAAESGGSPTTFCGAFAACGWQMPKVVGTAAKIPLLRDRIFAQHQIWKGHFDVLLKAWEQAGGADDAVAALLKSLDEGRGGDASPLGLDRVLWDSLKQDLHLTGSEYQDKCLHDAQTWANAPFVEIDQKHKEIMSLRRASAENQDDAVAPSPAVKAAKEVLERLGGELSDAAGAQAGETVESWSRNLQRAGALLKGDVAIADVGAGAWRYPDLETLSRYCTVAARRYTVTRWLGQIESHLREAAKPDSWGFAQLLEGWSGRLGQSAYAIAIPLAPASEGAEPAAARRAGDEGTEPASIWQRAPADTQAAQAPAVGEPGVIPRCASHAFVQEAVDRCAVLLAQTDALTRLPAKPFDEGRDPAGAVKAAILGAWQTYADTYAGSWRKAYLEKVKELQGRLRAPTLAAAPQGEGAAQLDPAALNVLVRDVLDAIRQIVAATSLATWNPEHGSWTAWQSAALSPLADRLHKALDASWPACRRWKIEASRPDASKIPGNSLSDRLGEWWPLLHNALRELRLPVEFPEEPAKALEIPWPYKWGRIKAFQNDFGLEGEQLTPILEDIESRAQRFVSAEITRRLATMEQQELGPRVTDRGWPYLNEPKERADPLATVPFREFRQFLQKAQGAEMMLRALEQPLRTVRDDGALRRQDYYDACAKWRQFIWPSGIDREPDALDVRIDVKDLYSDEQDKQGKDTPQNKYRHACLRIGLRSVTNVDDDPERIPTWRDEYARRADKYKKAGYETVTGRWTWSSESDVAAFMALEDSEMWPACQYPLGKRSPLALCAYLVRYGRGQEDSGGIFVTRHELDLRQLLAADSEALRALQAPDAKPIVILGFQLRLSRDLPKPIRPLGGPESSAAIGAGG